MYSLLNSLLSDKKGGTVFTCFGPWHLGYILFFVLFGAAVFYFLRKKDRDTRLKVTRLFIHIPFGMYIAGFFLMPFAYGEIDIEKLPFHICTAMCVMCFLSYHVGFLRPLRLSFSLFAFISNLTYLIYPAGVMWHRVHPLSYRVLETLVFHGLMTVYGLLVLAFDSEDMRFRTCYKDLAVIGGMSVWALLGNFLYNGEVGEYSHFFNWFFVVRDPFYLLPEGIAPLIMPLFNVAIFFAADMLVYLICFALRRLRRGREKGTKTYGKFFS